MQKTSVLKSWLMGSCAIALAQAALGVSARSEEFVKTPDPEPTEIEAPWAQRIQDAINFGPVKFNAGVTVTEVFSDNIFVTRNNKQEDFYTVVSPDISAAVDVGAHDLNFRAGADLGYYNRFSSENYDDYYLGADGRLRLGATTSLFGGATYSWEHESRESPDAVNGSEPTQYRYGDYFAGIVHRSDNIIGRLGGTIETYDFDDTPTGGAAINNDDRDRAEYEIGTRIGYRFTSAYEAFGQAYWDARRYDDAVDDFGFRRDSDGYRLAVGIRGNAGPSLQGELYVGLLHQDYDDPAFGSVTEPDVGANLTWRAAPATTVRYFLDRSIEETTLAGSSGYVRSAMGASVSHELRPDLSASAHLQYSRNEYQDVGRTDHLIDSGLGLKYFFAPNLFVGAEYALLQRLSDFSGAEFTENRLMFRLGAQLAPGYEGDPASFAPFTSTYGPGSAYVGLQAGTGMLQSALNGPRGGGGGTQTADFGNAGWQGGIFGGYGVTVNRVYLGAELDAELGDQSWEHNGTPGANRVYSVEKKDSYELAGRLGYELENQALLYTRFGLVYSRFETPYLDDALNYTEGDDRQLGFRYGGGADFPLFGSVFGRMEYTITSYEDYDVTLPGTVDNFANAENLVRFGVGYRFNQGVDETKPAPAVDYSGFYAGAALGHGALISDNRGLRSGQPLQVDRAGYGGSLGLFGGYGMTFGDAYLGAEAEIETSDANWRIQRDPNGRIYSVDKDFSYGASLRAGYIVRKNTLIYGRVGVVETRFSNDYATTGVHVTSSETMTGTRYGGGVEMPIDDKMLLRLDYTWTEYDSYRVVYGANSDSFDNSENQFRVAVSYKF